MTPQEQNVAIAEPIATKCPACGSRNVSMWERFSELHGDVVGGKDCLDCNAMSRRWIGHGVGRFIWADGYAGKTVKDVEEAYLKTIGKWKE